MSKELKLLTEQQAACVLMMEPAKAMAELRERGLIEPKPVDPRRLLARKAVADHYNYANETQVSEYCAEVEFVLKGMELAQPKPLTREKVREAVIKAFRELGGIIAPDDFYERPEHDTGDARELIDRLHAALTGDA